MQFSLYTNQAKTIEWGISLSHATLFGFIYNAATWAHKVGDYWNVSKGKILEELPILTDKIDTVYRMEKELIDKGLLEKKLIDGKDYFKVTEKGLGWNQTEPVKKVGKKSEARKNIRSRSENNPISNGKLSDVSNNQISNNQHHIKNTSALPDKTDPLMKLKPKDIPDEFWKTFSNGVDPGHMRDWLAVRKVKRAVNTQTAFERISKQAEAAGLSMATVIDLCAGKGWVGFEASWDLGKTQGASHATSKQNHGKPDPVEKLRADFENKYGSRDSADITTVS